MNVQVDITKNGKTTLATEGLYCDRDIDVNVEVGSDYTTILDGTITGDYVNENVTILRMGAFSGCRQLKSVSLPNCTEFSGTNTFYLCENITDVNLPNLTRITDGSNTFYNAKYLKEANFPKLTTIGTTTQRMFQTCMNIKKISLPLLGGTTIQAYTFSNCNKMETLILGGDTLNPLGNTNAFTNAGNQTENGFSVYVPDDLVEAYKTATNWSTLASKIKPMSELEE